MIIYGVYRCDQPSDTLFNLFADPADAEAYIESRKYPHSFYVQELQVY
jgi:hypothetical protein